MASKLSEEQFYIDKQTFREKLNIDLLIDYKDYKSDNFKYPCKCLKCGYEDVKRLSKLKGEHGCPVCAGLKIIEEIFNKDKEDFKNNLYIDLLINFDEYKGNKIKYPYKCLKCECVGEKEYYSLKNGFGCGVCAGRLITEEKFNKDKEDFKNNLNIELLINFDEYKGNKTKYPYKCLKCGYEDKKSYNDLKGKHGCPKCWCDFYKSKAEQEIKEYIETIYDKQIITSDREILNGKELDIYLPDINLAFEFNGIYWHSNNYKSKKYHYNKYKKCQDKNIRLYQIYEDDWRDNQELIKEHIKNLINEEEFYDFSDNYIEIDLDFGYDVNKYLNHNYVVKGIKENIMIKDNKYKIYGSGLMMLERIYES